MSPSISFVAHYSKTYHSVEHQNPLFLPNCILLSITKFLPISQTLVTTISVVLDCLSFNTWEILWEGNLFPSCLFRLLYFWLLTYQKHTYTSHIMWVMARLGLGVKKSNMEVWSKKTRHTLSYTGSHMLHFISMYISLGIG